METLVLQGRPHEVAVRAFRPGVSVETVAAAFMAQPPQSDCVAFEVGGSGFLAFGSGLPALKAGDPAIWRGQAGLVRLAVNVVDTVEEMTDRALDREDRPLGKGIAKLARSLHLDRALDRTGLRHLIAVIAEWGPLEALSEPIPGAETDWLPPSPMV